MPGPTDDYFAYKQWFEKNHGALHLPDGCAEPNDPLFIYANQYTWSVEWFLLLKTPSSYIRIFENFARRSRLSVSRRIHFAYHYGPVVKADEKEMPVREPSDPVFVRIDNIHAPAHLHPEGDPTRHLPQENVKGLTLDDIDLFKFVKCAFQHRKGLTIERAFGYRIV